MTEVQEKEKLHKGKQKHDETSSCALCDQDDTQEMVACDVCDAWYHFQCVNVTSEIKDHDWMCDTCKKQKQQSDDKISVRSETSSRLSQRRRRTQLELQKLEDTRRLEKERLEEERRLQENLIKETNERRRHLDNVYIEKRYQLLNSHSDDESDEETSVPGTQGNQPVNKMTNHVSTATQSHLTSKPSQVQQYQQSQPRDELAQQLDHALLDTQNQPNTHNRFAVPVKASLPNESCLKFKVDYDQNKFNNFNIFSRPTPGASVQRHNSSTFTPNTQQLIARQSIPKELPTFSGRPDEWPLFISSYETSTTVCGFNHAENLLRLQKSLKGNALDAVKSRLLLPSNVPSIIETLRMLYGRPELIVQFLLQKVRSEPAPKVERLESIVTFALSVQNLCSTMEASNLVDHLNNPMLIQELVSRLPPQIKLKWAVFKQNIFPVNLIVFSEWLYNLATAISDISYTVPQSTEGKYERHNKGYVHVHSEQPGILNEQCQTDFNSNSLHQRKCYVCKQNCKRLENCNRFRNLNHSDKWNVVKQYKLCRTCLYVHGKLPCKFNKQCGVNGCTFRHHRLLHNYNRDNKQEIGERNLSSAIENPVATSESNEESTNKNTCNLNTHRDVNNSVLFRVLPVILYGNDKQVNTFAFFDEGSSLTLINESLVSELGLHGTVEPLCLKWTGNTHRTEKDSKLVSVGISKGNNSSKRYNISNVRTVSSLNLPTQSLNIDEMRTKYPYLKDVPIVSYENATPQILIGLNHWKLGVPLKVKEGQEIGPIAAKTRIGWTVYGPYNTTGKNRNDNVVNVFYSFHACECQHNREEETHNMIKEYFSLDSLGVTNNIKVLRPQEEEKAVQILQSQTRRKGDRFETSLLWKYDDIELPDSFPMAKHRYVNLQKRLERNPKLAEHLQEQINQYLVKGYIRKLTVEELNQVYPRTWYLPIFPVTNPNKPTKIRLVWDAAAKVNGMSLNTMLLKGPDQLTSLPGVLFRFRERKVAICADISEMFHQVLIRDQDQHAQRFLWNQNIHDEEPEIYVMQVMTFGATCSPSSAQYVKNVNAQEFENDFPRAAKCIIENHYVDDLLDSVDTEQEAVKLANEVKQIHKHGGFHIRNWISNSVQVTKSLGENPACIEKGFKDNETPGIEKVLGMWWCTSTDCFTYKLTSKPQILEILKENRKPTKREVLKIMMTIFDPLGLIANVLVYIKIILQEIWRSSIGWDEVITDDQFKKWSCWVNVLKTIDKIQIPRCYTGKIKAETSYTIQLHVFVDASESAFAAVAYFRISTDQTVECSLVAAKTRVAPLKIISIPRLELEAARLGARLAKFIIESHSIEIQQKYFWSDSKTVLSWLNSDQRNYRQFVAFRVSEILELSNANEWRYVPTKLNVADEATKWQKLPNVHSDSRWFLAPAFLHQSENEWPSKGPIGHTTEEIKSNLLTHINVHTSLIDYERFSKWGNLLRTQVYILRFIHNVTAPKKGLSKRIGIISKEEFKLAEIHLYRQAQNEAYLDEITIIQNNEGLPIHERKKIRKTSPLYKQSPYLDEHRVLRMQGRIDAAYGVDFYVKRPILLPKGHPITKLIVQDYHHRFHHISHETVINELRQKYSIPKLRTVLKHERKQCQQCKNESAMPNPPQMGSLPEARLSTFCRPFSEVGIDYFGPLYVSVGRRTEKRWGVLITCLTIRAIHLEIASSLSADSCILAIKRFIARRGMPNKIYSDNGTNFHGANRELQSAIIQNQETLSKEFTDSIMEWRFIPPSSPHMGGSWERLVQSVKKVLHKIMPQRNPTDELLYSMLLEVEKIINTRPLTYIPIDNESDEALTPNHFLLGSSSGQKPEFIEPTKADVFKNNWMKSQQFANHFWKRWILEYLPTLTRKTKWFHPVKPIEKGDIVVIVDETMPRNSWPKGKILEAIKNKDGQVRKVIVQTSTGIYERPAVKIAVLDVKFGKPSQLPDVPGGSVGNADISNGEIYRN